MRRRQTNDLKSQEPDTGMKDTANIMILRKNDLVLAVSVVLIALFFICIVKFFQKDGGFVKVTVDGKVTASYSLNQDGQFEIFTEQGRNLLIIKDCTAYITEADCPDLLCTKQHAISKDGESIVCLPHRVVITVEKQNGENSFDAIVY